MSMDVVNVVSLCIIGYNIDNGLKSGSSVARVEQKKKMLSKIKL